MEGIPEGMGAGEEGEVDQVPAQSLCMLWERPEACSATAAAVLWSGMQNEKATNVTEFVDMNCRGVIRRRLGDLSAISRRASASPTRTLSNGEPF